MATDKANSSRSPLPPISLRRTAIAALAIIGCLFIVWLAARAGFSRLLSKYATASASLPAANAAVRLAPSDPEAHRARGAVLRYLDQLPDASKEYETAVSLRPRDDLNWLELGIVRDELDDSEGALSAFNESVRKAPYYAHPRWQRGNVLLRQGRYDEAFADLRQAANSNRDLQPNLVDLAWAMSGDDAKLTERILQIDNSQMRISYARFLARKGKGPEAIEQLHAVGTVSDQIRNEIVANLISKKAFKEAFQIWTSGISSSLEKQVQPAIFDGGFEAPLSLDETGFGWRFARGEDTLNLSVDTSEKESGTKSLRVQFNGNSNPTTAVLSQLILVEPAKRYRISFVSRTKDITGAARPIVTVSEAKSDQLLTSSAALPQGTSDWQVQSFEFVSGAESQAVTVSLRRENCASTPCPIFGFIWLDSFEISAEY